MAGESPISPLILAELYESGDEAFLDQLLRPRGGQYKPVLGVIEKWKKDSGTYARRMKLRLADGATLTAEHRVIFKRLFKQAWHDQDHELMGAFLVHLDRTLRRRRARTYQLFEGAYATVEHLRLSSAGNSSIFSTPTTHYLRRRAWRYFRRVGFTQPAEYPAAVARALVRYVDDDVLSGANLLDNWGLMHACFGKSPVLTFNKRHTNLRASQRLASLDAAPMFEKLWAEPA